VDIGIPELLIVLVIVVLFFGTGRLVNLGKELGQGIREFRDGLKGSEESQAEEKETPADKATKGVHDDANS
jgi:sec-independent protein translocase protein TatA